MAAYSLEEQEKIDGLKAWWNRFGTVLAVLLTVALFAMGAMKAWEYYQQKQAHQAADLYALLQQIQASDDATKINDAAQLVMTGYPSSGYAPRAAPLQRKLMKNVMLNGRYRVCNGLLIMQSESFA
jgi:predicted negative regulator of RcsB-dependent stress response